MYKDAWASATKMQKIVNEEMREFVEESDAQDVSLLAGVGQHGDGSDPVDEVAETPPTASESVEDDELFELIKTVATSQVQTEGKSPLGTKPEQFAAWASVPTQQALWERREQLAKEILLGTTLDHVHASLNSIRRPNGVRHDGFVLAITAAKAEDHDIYTFAFANYPDLRSGCHEQQGQVRVVRSFISRNGNEVIAASTLRPEDQVRSK